MEVVRQRKVVDKQRANDDDRRGKSDTREDTAAGDRLVLLQRWFAHHVVVDGVDPEPLAWRSCRFVSAPMSDEEQLEE